MGKFWHTIRRICRLWGAYARMDAGWFLRDTKLFLLNVLTDVVSNGAAVTGVLLLSERFGGIGGMSRGQVLFQLGYALLVEGVFMLFFMMNNVGHISRPIGRGQVDHMLLQPVPLWMQLITNGFIPASGSSMLVCGVAITAWAARSLGLAVTPLWVLALLGCLLCSAAVTLGFTYIVSAVAFWAPVAGEEVASTTVDLFFTTRMYPLGGTAPAVQTALCTVLPVGLAAWFPANLLLGQHPNHLPAALLAAMAAALTVLATLTFRKGLKHYATTGSVRYSDRGFRR